MKLVDSFDIDNGELDGLTPQMVFCLGVEFEMFRTKLKRGKDFSMDVHTKNAPRLLAMCQRRNRTAKETWIHDDFDEWRTITVKAKQEPE